MMRSTNQMEGVVLTPLSIVPAPGGDIMHALKSSEAPEYRFGEAYFSWIAPGAIKAWKRHREMTLNIVVPLGRIRFVVVDDRTNSTTRNSVAEFVLAPKGHYARLTVAPGLWLGFQGLASYDSLLLNLADVEHDPAEIDRLAPDRFKFDW